MKAKKSPNSIWGGRELSGVSFYTHVAKEV